MIYFIIIYLIMWIIGYGIFQAYASQKFPDSKLINPFGHLVASIVMSFIWFLIIPAVWIIGNKSFKYGLKWK